MRHLDEVLHRGVRVPARVAASRPGPHGLLNRDVGHDLFERRHLDRWSAGSSSVPRMPFAIFALVFFFLGDALVLAEGLRLGGMVTKGFAGKKHEEKKMTRGKK